MNYSSRFATTVTFALYTCLLSLFFVACSKNNGGNTTLPVTPTPTPTPTPTATFVKGADVSWITEMEANGIKFYNSAGTQQEGMALLQSLGMNTIRLRVWVNPSNSYNASADVVAKAVRAKNLGLRVMIDFHYSDTWADPGNQTTPAAWASQDINGLKTSVASHTTAVLTALRDNGVTPEWVQIGNETNDGMLWPLGKASTNMANFAALINAGYDAAKAVFANIKVVVHLSNGYDNSLYRWLFDGLKNNGGKYDVIGMSLYPTASTWATYNSQCLVNMNDMVARYGKEVMVVEVGMPWDGAADCKSFISDLITKMQTVSNSKGLGVMYWEPLAYNSWKGYTLGAFDNSGKPTIALAAFQ
jgi:arabinogalactan endo-1,4-beta-galactosidase